MRLIVFGLLFMIILSSCSQRIYTDSLQDQRKKHTQKVTSKDISKGRIFVFVCIGMGIFISSNLIKE